MKTKKADSNKCLKLEALVRKYLRLDPGALARLGAEAGASLGTCESGLHELMRRVLERAIAFLWLPDDAVIRLSSAKVPGWPDAQTFNCAQLLSWGLARELRRLRGKRQLPLHAADTCVIDFLPKQVGAERTPVLELMMAVGTLFDIDFDNIRDAPGPDARQPVAIAPLIREMLGVEPERLIRPYYDAQKDADEAIARDPEAQAVAGFSALLTRSIFNFPSIPAALPPGGLRCLLDRSRRRGIRRSRWRRCRKPASRANGRALRRRLKAPHLRRLSLIGSRQLERLPRRQGGAN